MIRPVTVLRTRITPPRLGARLIERPRLTRLLGESLHYRLTLVQAGAGFGKTTALAALAGSPPPLIWYQLMDEDRDPLVFLLHLCHASRLALPELSDLPISLLESWDGTSSPLPSTQILDEWLNSLAAVLCGPVLLVLDDAHLVAPAAEIVHLIDRLVGLAPDDLHVLLAGRAPLDLPGLPRWTACGMVCTIDRPALAFTGDEIAALFAQAYGYELTGDEAERLLEATEGWAIALQLVWQSLRGGAFASVEDVLSNQATTLDSLFHILATEIFAGQPADVQAFLRATSVLRVITPEACDALYSAGASLEGESLRAAAPSAAMLAYLRRIDLFLVDLGDGTLRYHHIFHSFLEQLTEPAARRATHLLAAAHFQQHNDFGEAIYHLQKAGQSGLSTADIAATAALLESYGAQLLASGRLDTLAAHLAAVPPEVLQQHPALLFYLGELARLRSRFQEALGWYQQAETAWRQRGQPEGVGRALRGQARVYLDTVNPSQAESLLEQSIRLSEGVDSHEMRARLYELLAENKLNLGHIEEAENLRQQADALRSAAPSDSQLLYRVLLRTGRLDEARRRLEERAAAEQLSPVLTPRAHRETHLLLSLVYALQGRGEAAYASAREGGQRGVDMRSPFVTAVGHLREGHALALLPGPRRFELAREQYEKAIAISRELAVPRLIVEASWGLCRVYGYSGDLAHALPAATEGIDIATAAGDEWIASLLRVSMGAGLTMAGRYEAALEWLSRALQGFLECSDSFGACAARLWLAAVRRQQGRLDLLSQLLPAVLAACEDNGYDYLLTRPTFLGPPDERVFTPLLVLARERGWRAEYAGRLLASLGLGQATHHPGYRVRVFTLGGFAAYKGETAVAATSWRRAKARQLFQLLLTYRHTALDRDQILEHLWPGMEPTAAGRNFKVTLNTLYQVLEPQREPGAESAFVHRDGASYCLRPGADLWLDAEQFTQLIAQARAAQASPVLLHPRSPASPPSSVMSLLEEAVALYKGDYLPEAIYETWAAAERERLAVMFLSAADRLTELYLEARRYEQAVELAQRILAADDCWERAYRHLMLAYHRLGNRGQIGRVYQRCVQTLRDELDVAPTDETMALFAHLTA
jgi:ATP/maltotriose-dependent transcriptional regulator MalT/DNA-binding SARP family transcriptional activator